MVGRHRQRITDLLLLLRRQGDATLTRAHARAVEVIHTSGERLLTLINDVLDMAKIEARKLEVCPADIDLLRFLETIIGMFQIRAAQKPGITFVYQQTTPLPTIIHTDEQRLHQILINLIGNAVKFTDQGAVTLRVGLTAHHPGAAQAADKPQRVTCTLLVEVIDTGIGIPPDKLADIFLPFEQVSDPARRTEGAGLGLAITRSLVEALNGKLEVVSKPCHGSTLLLQVCVQAIWEGLHVQSPAEISAIPAFPAPTETLPAPPPAEMEFLLDLALKGELPRLQQHALTLAQTDHRYAPFIERLCHLAAMFDEDQLLALIERHTPTTVRQRRARITAPD